MKKHIAVLFLLLITNLGYAQYKVNLKKWNLMYETPERLKKYRAERNVAGRDNDNYAIDVEIVKLEDESQEFTWSAEYGARELATDMEVKNIERGDIIPKIRKAFYFTGQNTDVSNGSLYPVILLVIINEDMRVAFEITIDCYNKDLSKGVQIAKSFEFIHK